MAAELPVRDVLPARDPAGLRPKKRLVRRSERDLSQEIRHAVQGVFLLVNVLLGAEFCVWVRDLSAGAHPRLSRPPGIDGWLPIAGLMNVRYFAETGRVPAIHPAAMFLLLAFAGISLAFRKAFCSWLCPVGTLSERIGAAGRRLFGRYLRVPRIVDVPLRGLKYFLLGFFLWAIVRMSAPAIEGFMRSDYGLIADVKLLEFFRRLGPAGISVVGALVLGSFLVRDFWCRYLCPYGALMGLVSLVSSARVRRDPLSCSDCGKCSAACPAALPVDRLRTVRSAECTGCFACVAACPVRDALALSLPRKRTVGPAAVAAGIAIALAGVIGFARTAGRWQSRVPLSTYERLVPRSGETGHPMP